jgi:hypothetical protein
VHIWCIQHDAVVDNAGRRGGLFFVLGGSAIGATLPCIMWSRLADCALMIWARELKDAADPGQMSADLLADAVMFLVA